LSVIQRCLYFRCRGEKVKVKKFNKAVKAIRAASLDIWEGKFVCGRALKREGKKTSNRATRRLGKALIAEAA